MPDGQVPAATARIATVSLEICDNLPYAHDLPWPEAQDDGAAFHPFGDKVLHVLGGLVSPQQPSDGSAAGVGSTARSPWIM